MNKNTKFISIKSNYDFSKNIRSIVKLKNYKQNYLSLKTNLKQGSISRVVSSKSNPTLDTMLKLLDALDYKLYIIPSK